MVKLVALSALLSISFTLPASAENLQANCFYVGSYKLSYGAISNGSAVVTDKDFEARNGLVDLKVRRKIFFKGTEKVNLGHNYSLVLQLDFQKMQPMGSRDYPIPRFMGHALLKFKDKAVSSGSMSTERVTSQYIDGTGNKFYEVSFELDNTALREKLGASEQPGLDLLDLVRESPEKAQLFKDFGDGEGVLLRAHINCEVPADVQSEAP